MPTRPLLAFAVAAAFAALGLAPPALASSLRHTVPGRPAAFSVTGSPATPISSPNFAGYQVNGTAPGMTATTTFVVPEIRNCGSANAAISPAATLQTSSGASGAAVFVGCLKGKPRYFPVLVVNSAETKYKSLVAHPGDKVVLTASEDPTLTKVSVLDKTRKSVSKTMTGAGSSGVSSPDVGEFEWSTASGQWPVPDFGTLKYSASVLDGLPFGSYGSSLEQFDQRTSTGTLQIKTSAFVSDSESFTEVFKHS